MLEIDAELFAGRGEHQPAIEQIGVAALSRRAEIEEFSRPAGAPPSRTPRHVLSRMKRSSAFSEAFALRLVAQRRRPSR